MRLAWPAALCAALYLGGCASVGSYDASPTAPGSARTPAGQPAAPRDAMAGIVVGASTRADVSAALGKAIAVPFDSGYEVWVYRWAGADRTTRVATELVLLFDASGVVAKMRMRPGYPARE